MDWIEEAFYASGKRDSNDEIYEACVRLFGRRKAREYELQMYKAPSRMPLIVAWRWAIRVVDEEARQYYRDEEPECKYALRQLR